MADRERITIRLPAPELVQLRDEYSEGYPKHRMTWNAWLLARLTK